MPYKVLTHNYRPPVQDQPDPMDDAWLAGFYEGEGHLRNARDPRQEKRVLALCITQTNLEPLEKCQRLYGGIIVHRRSRGKNWKPTSEWRLQGGAASTLTQRIFPLLSKRRQLQVLPLVHWTDGREKENQRDPISGRFIRGERS